jgi:hypothetical protein
MAFVCGLSHSLPDESSSRRGLPSLAKFHRELASPVDDIVKLQAKPQ